jgi:hypothetical protein
VFFLELKHDSSSVKVDPWDVLKYWLLVRKSAVLTVYEETEAVKRVVLSFLLAFKYFSRDVIFPGSIYLLLGRGISFNFPLCTCLINF